MVATKTAWKQIIARALAVHAAEKAVQVPMPDADALVLEADTSLYAPYRQFLPPL